jgi:hypothetical protein
MAAIKAKGGGGAKWAVLGGLVLAAWVAVEAGWAGYGWAQLKSAVFPRDESLLAWVPGDTSAVVIVDPHQLKLEALGAEGTSARTALQRTRDDVKKATGIDLAFDVDKLLLSNALAVARGRFDAKKLGERLAEHRYANAEHEGVTYLVRAGEDAMAVVDGAILLYGDESGVKASITAHARGTSLEKHEPTLARLRQVGWDHAVISTVRITDDKPSVRQILSGSTGPQAFSSSLSTQAGLDLDTIVQAASSSAAEELAKLLDEKRKNDAGALALLGPESAKVLGDMARKATITVDPATSAVKIHLHLDPAQVDTLAKQLRSSQPLAEAYKNVRLFQLLAP